MNVIKYSKLVFEMLQLHEMYDLRLLILVVFERFSFFGLLGNILLAMTASQSSYWSLP